MASSYTTGFSLEKIGSGEQSGAWGDTTNFNWDIVDRLAAYKAVAITTNADTATLTVREASPGSGTENLQDGMYRMIKFTGALDSNCTVTIAPNTAPAYFIIENATTDSGSSGPYSIILSQGSGANVTVQNGKNVMVYCDGAGGGAAVVDALADLQIGTLEVTGAAAIDGDATFGNDIKLLSDSSVLSFGVDGDVTVTHDPDDGLFLKSTATPDGNPFLLTLQTGETDIALNDIIGRINFQAPDEAAGTDAILVTARISAISEGDFSSSNNATKLSFATGASEAAQEKMSLSSGGNLDVSGDVTGSTINADGDTAAGDNAAIGYTSAEGLILTGQGSTSDITVKNDADETVFIIPTGTDDVKFSDNAQLQFGAGGDLNLYSSGSSGVITAASNLRLYTADWGVSNAGASESMISAVENGAVTLYFNNGAKIATSNIGATITGTLIATTSTAGGQGGSTTLDFAANQNFVLTLTSNITLANPSTEQVGQSGIICFIQDAGGSNTLSLGTDYETAGGSGITLSTAGNALDIIPYFVSASARIQLGAVQKAFS